MSETEIAARINQLWATEPLSESELTELDDLLEKYPHLAPDCPLPDSK